MNFLYVHFNKILISYSSKNQFVLVSEQRHFDWGNLTLDICWCVGHEVMLQIDPLATISSKAPRYHPAVWHTPTLCDCKGSGCDFCFCWKGSARGKIPSASAFALTCSKTGKRLFTLCRQGPKAVRNGLPAPTPSLLFTRFSPGQGREGELRLLALLGLWHWLN